MFQGIYSSAAYSIVSAAEPNAYYFGIRRAPYTTDMTKNALTFKHLQNLVPLPDHPISGGEDVLSGGWNAQIHASGELWANALLEGYVSMIQQRRLRLRRSRTPHA